MSGIVCAIRGGPSSQPTIQTAIDLAKSTNLTVHFLYVVNINFLSHTSSSRVDLVYHEMDRMGEFILLVAQDKAQAQGVPSDGTVRHGKVGDEIVALGREIKAEYVVLGQPQSADDKDIFTHDHLQKFKERIEKECNAKVVLAEGAHP
ncbi:MAG: universal stress protein [Chloroflexota bacterium]